MIVSAKITNASSVFDNGISRFIVHDDGRVLDAYWLGNPTNDMLGNSGELNFGIFYDGASDTLWLNDFIMQENHNWNGDPRWTRYIGTATIPGNTINIVVDARLLDGKAYLDLRYEISVSSTLTKVKPYFYMEPSNGATLLRAKAPNAASSPWQMVRDTQNNWGGKNWTNPYVYSADALGLVVRRDDYKGGNATDVWNAVDSGNWLVPAGYSQHSNPAWGLRIQGNVGLHPQKKTFTIQPGSNLVMEARLEPAPEPSTICLMLTGLFGIAGMARRRFLK